MKRYHVIIDKLECNRPINAMTEVFICLKERNYKIICIKEDDRCIDIAYRKKILGLF